MAMKGASQVRLMPIARTKMARSLPAAQMGGALIAGLALVTILSFRLSPSRIESRYFIAVAEVVWAASLVYAIATAARHYLARRRTLLGQSSGSKFELASQLAVLAVAAGCILRGPTSVALLAGIEEPLAALVIVSLASAGLIVAELAIHERKLPADRDRRQAHEAAHVGPVWVMHAAASWILVAALVYLELQTLPHMAEGIAAGGRASTRSAAHLGPTRLACAERT